MTNYINLTSTVVVLNDGRVFPPSGIVAFAEAVYSQIEGDFCTVSYAKPKGLLTPQDGIRYIVSHKFFTVVDRNDLVTPANGHPKCVRNDEGEIISVPCFLEK